MKIEWNKVTWYSKLVAVVVFVATFFIGIYIGIQYESANSTASSTQYGTPSAVPPSSAPSATSTGSTPTTGHAPGVSSSPTGMKLAITSPASGDQWILGDQNTIRWNRGAGALDGNISLLDASTGAVVGWIQEHLSTEQTFFPWNTDAVFVGPTSPLSKNITTGNYRIELAFDSPNIPPVIGPVFSIISPAEAQIPTVSVAISAGAFSSPSITLTQGTKLIFVNHDPKSYGITVSSGASPLVIGTSTSQNFDTSILSPGNYAFYSTVYPSLRLTVVVEARVQ